MVSVSLIQLVWSFHFSEKLFFFLSQSCSKTGNDQCLMDESENDESENDVDLATRNNIQFLFDFCYF